MRLLIVIISTFSILASVFSENLPCIPKYFGKDSFVCVCNSTYCDTIEKIDNLTPGSYAMYSSDKASRRFKITTGSLSPGDSPKINLDINEYVEENGRAYGDININVDTTVKYQEIFGFGGAVTDSTCINSDKLGENTREHIFKSYFSKNGLEYNTLRVPIGGSDFSTHPYAYNEAPINDTQLRNFSLSMEDLDMKIPFIKKAIQQATDDIHIMAAAWSPPPWMKTNDDYGGYSFLLEDFYHTWALYHMKFLQEYRKNGVDIWGFSTGNEPSTSLVPIKTFNSLGWTPATQADWVANHMGPMLRSSEFSGVKLFAIDDQRFSLPWWLNRMESHNKNAMGFIDGVALHFYWDRWVPTYLLDLATKAYPGKMFLGTEACAGPNPWDIPKVSLGSWGRAELYIKNILENLNHGYSGWIDWNLALDKQGGPNWNKNFVDSTIIVIPESDEFYKQPMFYGLGHFSKFIPRTSTRVGTNISTNIPHAAFVTPSGTVVVVFYNSYRYEITVNISLGNEKLSVATSAYSINTVNIQPSK